MKIVILDGFTLNAGDLSWAPVEKFGEVAAYDRSKPEEVLERSQDAEIILTSKVVLNEEIFSKLPKLKYIGVLATGYNNIDLEAAKKRDIVVTNIPDYCSSSVAQMVFAHILELTNRVAHYTTASKNGKWSESPDFCFWDHSIVELDKKVLGLVGLGHIGSKVANIAKSFGMKVIAYDIHPKNTPGVEFVDLDTLFKSSDILSLHCPLTKDNTGIINQSNLSKMKKTSFIVNTSRGPLVNEGDLSKALNDGVIAGAGLDVLEKEPAQKDNPLLKAKNCYLTPHISFATLEARSRLIQITADNIEAYLNNKPLNLVK